MSKSNRSYWSGKNNRHRNHIPKFPNYVHCSQPECKNDIMFMYVPEITSKGWTYIVDTNIHWFCPKHPNSTIKSRK